MPRAGTDFTPAQKSAITRAYNKYFGQIALVNDGIKSFIPYPKKKNKRNLLKNVDGIRTNKGIFYKYPGAKPQVKVEDGKKITRIVIRYKKLREIFIPFPLHIMHSMELILDFVELMLRKYSYNPPDYILWSVYGNRGAENFDPDYFFTYGNDLGESLMDENGDIDTHFNGIYFGWYPERLKSKSDPNLL